jgi:hypothetical protein
MEGTPQIRSLSRTSAADGGYSSDPEFECAVAPSPDRGYLSDPIVAEDGYGSDDVPNNDQAPTAPLAKRRRGRPRKPTPVDEEPLPCTPALGDPAPLAAQVSGALLCRSALECSLAYWPKETQATCDYIIRCIAQPEPDNFPETGGGACSKHIFGTRLNLDVKSRRSNTWRAEAAAAGLGEGWSNERLYHARYLECAAMVDKLSRIAWAAFIGRILREIELGHLNGIMLLMVGQGDEASAKLRTSHTSGTAAESIGETAKVVQNVLRLGVLLQTVKTGRLRFVTGTVPCPLRLVDRCTAETLHEVYRAVYGEDLPGFGTETRQHFMFTFTGHTQDKAGSCEKQRKAARRDANQAANKSSCFP